MARASNLFIFKVKATCLFSRSKIKVTIGLRKFESMIFGLWGDATPHGALVYFMTYCRVYAFPKFLYLDFVISMETYYRKLTLYLLKKKLFSYNFSYILNAVFGIMWFNLVNPSFFSHYPSPKVDQKTLDISVGPAQSQMSPTMVHDTSLDVIYPHA